MAARRLSRQQRERIAAGQQRRREQAADPADADGQGGLLISHFGRELEIEDASGLLHRCTARRHLGPLAAGDRVVWRSAAAGCVVLAREPRRSELVRHDGSGKARLMAANVDRLLVVIAPEPAWNAWQLDRYLVAAEHCAIPPAIVVNKVDLLDAAGRSALRERLRAYADIGYPLVFTSSHEQHGQDPLRALLRAHISVVVGQSGVGKSSLVNTLVPDAAARIGAISTASGGGRHTTTAARLYHLPDGGALIDSPGVREFGLERMPPEDVARGFPEFRPYLGRCRFRDCSHLDDPGCAVHRGVEEGTISPARLESYRRILEFFQTPA